MNANLFGIKRLSLIISSVMLFFVFGCASAPKEFDAKITGPQLIVEPDTITLGVANLLKKPIIFKGKGFKPGDSVFVSLLGVEKGGQKMDIALADAEVDPTGGFAASVAKLSKITELLRAEIGRNEKMEDTVVVSKPPIPTGTYTARAVSMESNLKAETPFCIKGPSVGDSIKDWLGGLAGKIVKK